MTERRYLNVEKGSVVLEVRPYGRVMKGPRTVATTANLVFAGVEPTPLDIQPSSPSSVDLDEILETLDRRAPVTDVKKRVRDLLLEWSKATRRPLQIPQSDLALIVCAARGTVNKALSDLDGVETESVYSDNNSRCSKITIDRKVLAA